MGMLGMAAAAAESAAVDWRSHDARRGRATRPSQVVSASSASVAEAAAAAAVAVGAAAAATALAVSAGAVGVAVDIAVAVVNMPGEDDMDTTTKE